MNGAEQIDEGTLDNIRIRAEQNVKQVEFIYEAHPSIGLRPSLRVLP